MVEVTMKNHTIENIALVKHDNGKGKSAEKIIDSVIAQQSLEVDAISSATRSSETILAAIENALKKGIG